ncbi:MFS transporter [Levilactobacillus andaensis]|uniref:MFS transporter n=1 Tax=Levilactobacillus andaensis TaxID=2799570 RepID=UPI00194545E8|nr:MFS transporter [Levilactobacillus andaensis]
MDKIKRVIVSDFLGTLTVSALMTYTYWHLYQQTRSQTVISILGTFSMVMLLFAFVGGYVVDRHSKIRLLRVIATIRLVMMGCGALIILVWHQGTAVLFGIVMVDALLGVVYGPLTESVAPTLVADDSTLFTANSWVATASQISSIASSALAVLLVYMKTPALALGVAFLALVLSVTALSRIANDPAPVKRERLAIRETLQDFAQGLHLVVRNPMISYMIPVALLTNFGYWSIWLLMPKFSVDIFGRYPFVYNLIDITLTVGGIAGATLFSKVHRAGSSAKWYPVLLVGQAVMMILLGVSGRTNPTIENVVLVGVAWLGYGFFNSISAVIYFSIVQLSADKDKIGLIIGAVLTLFSIANPIAAVASVPLTHLASLPILIIGLGGVMVLATIPVFRPRFLRELKRFDSHET